MFGKSKRYRKISKLGVKIYNKDFKILTGDFSKK